MTHILTLVNNNIINFLLKKKNERFMIVSSFFFIITEINDIYRNYRKQVYITYEEEKVKVINATQLKNSIMTDF